MSEMPDFRAIANAAWLVDNCGRVNLDRHDKYLKAQVTPLQA